MMGLLQSRYGGQLGATLHEIGLGFHGLWIDMV